jgi:hypothetical protein
MILPRPTGKKLAKGVELRRLRTGVVEVEEEVEEGPLSGDERAGGPARFQCNDIAPLWRLIALTLPSARAT